MIHEEIYWKQEYQRREIAQERAAFMKDPH